METLGPSGKPKAAAGPSGIAVPTSFRVVREGAHYCIGTFRDQYQIRDLHSDGAIAESYPTTPEGWTAAWAKFRELDERPAALQRIHRGDYLWTGHFTETHHPEGWQPGDGEGRVTRSYSPLPTEHDYVVPGDSRMILPVQEPEPETFGLADPARFRGLLGGSNERWRIFGVFFVIVGILQLLVDLAVAIALSISGLDLLKDLAMVGTMVLGFASFKLYLEPGLMLRRYPGSLRARKLARATLFLIVPLLACAVGSLGLVATRSQMGAIAGILGGSACLMVIMTAYLIHRSDVTRGFD